MKFFADIILRILNFSFRYGGEELLKHFGEQINERLLTQYIVYGPHDRLIVGDRVSKSNTLFNTRSGTISLGTGVMFGHNCMLLTGIHDYTKPGETRSRITLENANRDIVIEEGAWIASGVIVVGPCRIGKNAVIAAGAVVVSDIPEESFAAGIPARVIKKISIDYKE